MEEKTTGVGSLNPAMASVHLLSVFVTVSPVLTSLMFLIPAIKYPTWPATSSF